MILNIFSDPHLGSSRKTHTTRESAKRWTEMLFDYAMEASGRGVVSLLAGDLFDRTHNSELTILQGMQVAENCQWVMAGNHDESNRADTESSMDVLKAVLDDTVVSRGEFYKAYAEDGMGFTFIVPHHPTQGMFNDALSLAKGAAAESPEPFKYLFVHCNRGELPNMTEETLTILDEQEDELLTVFDRIFYGHIHQPAIDKGGRVVQIGNTFPTSFSDITHKFTWELNTRTNELTQHMLFDAKQHSLQLTLGDAIPGQEDILFIEVTGTGSRTEIAEYVQQVWEANPQALAVRANCQFVDNGVTVEEVDLSDLNTVITKGLEGTEMLELYNKLRSQLCN